MARILVVDDQVETLELLARLFRAQGYEVDAVADGDLAQTAIEETDYDVVFTDLRLGFPYDGLELLEMVKKARPRTQVVIMTAFSSVESSVLAMKAGAYDYITKPFKGEEVLLLAARAAERATLTGKVRDLEGRSETDHHRKPEIVGQSPAMVRMMRLVGQVARTDATVLIVGESGTGKELVAAALHQLSPRVDKPLVAVNCGAIPENLQESEFFGHVKGAFTGAIRTKTGLFEEAHTGTLFLDEVGETSLATQVKLLRFLQTGEVRRVGGNEATRVDARLVAATNRDLEAMIEAKAFREDLYYRLNIIAVEVPPLRDRTGDVEVLAKYFLSRFARKLGNGVTGFTDRAMKRLVRHRWPGNVRELENAVERAVTLARGTRVDVDDLPRLDRLGSAARSSRPKDEFSLHPTLSGEWDTVSNPFQLAVAAPARLEYEDNDVQQFPSLAEMERAHIERALAAFGGNRTRTSKALGISKATLWRKLKSYEAET
ncbi:MAG: sigma-54-dependent Fis family transcriptional regulator [Proteobacteria bacterium]|nr:sigma-54-dependent Fis family transcriptional regulator [Pseudomonadota bacterium]